MLGSILADEMGLGKTLQTISFFAQLAHMSLTTGPHLVVVPLSVLFNWMSECKRFCPSLRLIRVHTNDSVESNRLKAILNSNNFEICLTTYETVMP